MAAQHRSRALADHLPATLGRVSFALGLLFEHGLSAQALSAFFYVPSVLSVVVNTVIGVLIAGFKLLPGPF